MKNVHEAIFNKITNPGEKVKVWLNKDGFAEYEIPLTRRPQNEQDFNPFRGSSFKGDHMAANTAAAQPAGNTQAERPALPPAVNKAELVGKPLHVVKITSAKTKYGKKKVYLMQDGKAFFGSSILDDRPESEIVGQKTELRNVAATETNRQYYAWA